MTRIRRILGDTYRKIDLQRPADNNRRQWLDDKSDRRLQFHRIRTIGIPVSRLNSRIQPVVVYRRKQRNGIRKSMTKRKSFAEHFLFCLFHSRTTRQELKHDGPPKKRFPFSFLLEVIYMTRRTEFLIHQRVLMTPFFSFSLSYVSVFGQ